MKTTPFYTNVYNLLDLNRLVGMKRYNILTSESKLLKTLFLQEIKISLFKLFSKQVTN